MRTTTFLIGLALLAPAAAADVLVVDQLAGPGSTHTSLGVAIADAAEGDTVLVRQGWYLGVDIDGKGLIVKADRGASVVVGNSRIRNLAPGQSVVVAGLRVEAGASIPGWAVEDCEGPVWIEDCEAFEPYLPQFATPGCRVESCANVTIQRAHFEGSRAIGDLEAGNGLETVDSNVHVFDSYLKGGVGGAVTPFGTPAGAPGTGITQSGGTLWASGNTLVGGHGGGGASPFGCTDSEDGAPALRLVGAGPHARLLDNDLQPGDPGAPQEPCATGLPGPPVEALAGTWVEHAFAARSTFSENPVRAGEPFTVEFRGEPGDFAILDVAAGQRPIVLGAWEPFFSGGPFLPDILTNVELYIAPLDADGALSVPATGAAGVTTTATIFTQTAMIGASGEVVFGSGQTITFLGAGY